MLLIPATAIPAAIASTRLQILRVKRLHPMALIVSILLRFRDVCNSVITIDNWGIIPIQASRLLMPCSEVGGIVPIVWYAMLSSRIRGVGPT
jgi:hypothetical protein